MEDRVGQQIGTYRLIRLLGQSDWASVYLGEHQSLHTQVAIKVFTLQLTGDDAGRFGTEMGMLAHLAHPSLLRVLEGGLEGDRPFLVMDYAPGGNVRTRHPRGTILPAPVMFSYLKPIVATLLYLQERHLIHGNIKPENMLLGYNDALVLSEMNLPVLAQKRRALLPQQEASSAAYVAPEQLLGYPQPASDQYALGIVVYEWLSGDVPFHGSFQELSRQQLSVAPPPLRGKSPMVSSYVESLVFKALAKDPAQRFASVQAFAEELEQACQATQSVGEHPLPSSPELLPLAPTVKMTPPAKGAPVAGTILCTYWGHAHYVHTVAWSPDGARLASGSRDKTVQVWEAATGKPVLSFHGHADRVHAVAWSPDGTRLASAGHDGTVQVWEAATGRTLLTYRSNAPIVHALAWSPDGTRLASDSVQMVEVWDASTGSRILTYRGHTYGVNGLSWSPDGQYLASASTDQTVQVWDAAMGNARFTYRGHGDAVYALAWSPDGQYLVSGSGDHTVHVWGGTPVGTVSTYRGHPHQVHAVAWAPEGKRIASGDDEGTVHVWDVASGEPLFSYRGHGGTHVTRINAVAWSPDGKHIASASDDGTVQVWQAP